MVKISNNTNFNISKINFRAGNTRVYADFDGTYFPFNQDAIVRKDKNNIAQANKMYDSFQKFSSIAKEKLSMLITTGRSKLEIYGILNDFRESDIKFPSIKGYILRDGLEETNEIRSESLDDISNSRFLKQKEDIKKIILGIDNDITIFEPSSNKWINGKEQETLETLFENTKPKLRQKYVSIVSENNGVFELAFPPNIDIDKYYEKIYEYYENNKTDVDIKSYINDKNLYVPHQIDKYSNDYVFEPANRIFIIPEKNGVKPDKLNQPKQKVKEIIQNNSNDLVIVAGDSTNDIEMLNPLNYLDLLGITIDKTKPIDELLSQKDVLSAMDNLPLISIISGQNKCMDSLLKMKAILDKKKIYKIYVAKNPSVDLLKKIKLAMLSHSDLNSEYKYNLGYDLYEEILD